MPPGILRNRNTVLEGNIACIGVFDFNEQFIPGNPERYADLPVRTFRQACSGIQGILKAV